MNWDCFVCHATEDKETVARPLVEQLKKRPLRVWFDEDNLDVGDDLLAKIAQGLSQSRFGIVILSPSFFKKTWTNRELNGLFALERGGKKRILPVWHNVDTVQVNQYSSQLANRLGVATVEGIDVVSSKLVQAIEQEIAQLTTTLNSVIRLHPHSLRLLTAARDGDGRIVLTEHLNGFHVTAGNALLDSGNEPRTIALNWHCLKELEECQLVRRNGPTALVVTSLGYNYEKESDWVEAPAPALSCFSPRIDGLVRELMFAAVAGNGRLSVTHHMQGAFLNAGKLTREAGNDRREIASWETALQEMEEQGLVLRRSQTSTNSCWHVTHLGYLWADFMNAISKTKPCGDSG